MFEVYRGEDGDWYWRFVAWNNRVMADSAEGYRRRNGAERALERFLDVVRFDDPQTRVVKK